MSLLLSFNIVHVCECFPDMALVGMLAEILDKSSLAGASDLQASIWMWQSEAFPFERATDHLFIS